MNEEWIYHLWVGRPSVGGDRLLVGVRTLIVIVNFDTTFLSHPLPSYHHLELVHGDLSFVTKNGRLYLSEH
jgi:hypothetical protein